MTKSITKIALVTLVTILVIGMVGCAKGAETPQPETAGWSIKLNGVLTKTMTQEEFEEAANPSRQGVEVTMTDRKGVAHVYSGIPLWILCGKVDDEIEQGEDAFNDELASKGYNVTIRGTYGYIVNFSSKTVARNNDIIVANRVDGEPIPNMEPPLQLAGPELRWAQVVPNIAEIRLELD